MILRILVCSLFALSTFNALAGNMYTYKDNGGKVSLTNVSPSGNFDKFTKDVKITYYSDKDSKQTKEHKEKLMANMVEELRLAEERIRIEKEKLEKQNLKILTEWRKKGTLTPDKNQIILKDGKNGLVDIGAKIGMTYNQVVENTYWGKADRTYTVTDEHGKLDYWSYERYGGLVFDNGKLIKIHANSITD